MTPTDHDRERARELLPEHQDWCHWEGHGDCCGIGVPEDDYCDCGTGDHRKAIAAALAEERERARAPFLALADELEREAPHQEAWDGNEEAAYFRIVAAIRLVAEDPR